MIDSPRILVARFLRANNYNETLEAFLSEADLPSDAGELSAGALTIEKILDEKRLFDVSLNFEKVVVDDAPLLWSFPAPVLPTVIGDGVDDANILHVSVERFEGSSDGTITEGGLDAILATTASRKLHLLEAGSPYASIARQRITYDSPILSCLVLDHRYILTTHMSGKVMLQDYLSGVVISERRDHSKYVVKAAVLPYGVRSFLVATAGWDARVYLYLIEPDPSTAESSGTERPALHFGEPLAAIELATNPEALVFVKHPESQSPLLILTRRDSSFLYYYHIPNITAPLQPQLIGRQNLAPHSAGWIAFSPCDIAISPIDPAVAAVATSSMPHMKLLIVRLLIPPATTRSSANTTTDIDQTPAAQARAELALQDREEAAIMVHSNTLAPQTEYSTPALAWRPDGSGVWVNGDDGQVRGIETSSGKVISILRGAHEPGAKIRCLGSGTTAGSEVLVSGGFDRRLVVWDIDQPSAMHT